MKNHEDKVTAYMNMYYAGMLLRKIQEHLQMFAPKNLIILLSIVGLSSMQNDKQINR